MQLSTYQETILKHIRMIPKRKEAGKRTNFFVDAVAGSGKSTTLRLVVAEILKKFPNAKILSIQFNKHIQKEMEDRLMSSGVNMSGVSVLTSHSAGLRVLGASGYRARGKINTAKYYFLGQEIVKDNEATVLSIYGGSPGMEKDKKKKLLQTAISQLTDTVKMCMMTLTDHSAIPQLEEMSDKHSITVKSEMLQHVRRIVDSGVAGVKRGDISFEDMICMPALMKMNHPQYDFVLCDEAQDFNAAQMELAMKFKGKDGVIGGFGDPFQSIMAFAGAMTDSIPVFCKRAKARSLPLSICYRCPSKVLDLARLIVPHILNRDDCPEGEVNPIQLTDILTTAKASDYILCRTTAPLVKLCIQFISKRVPAIVKGREIGTRILKEYNTFLDLCDVEPQSIDEFIGMFSEYREAEKARAIIKNVAATKMAMTEDTFDCISVIANYLSDESRKEGITFRHTRIESEINSLFSDTESSSYVTLCTVHKAKGLEANNIFIINYHQMPFVFKGKELNADQMQQERNIAYVALTRAKDKLYIQGDGIDTMEDITRHTLTLAKI